MSQQDKKEIISLINQSWIEHGGWLVSQVTTEVRKDIVEIVGKAKEELRNEFHEDLQKARSEWKTANEEMRSDFNRYVGAVTEEFHNRLDIVVEIVLGLHDRFDALKADREQVDNQEKRIRVLETKFA